MSCDNETKARYSNTATNHLKPPSQPHCLLRIAVRPSTLSPLSTISTHKCIFPSLLENPRRSITIYLLLTTHNINQHPSPLQRSCFPSNLATAPSHHHPNPRSPDTHPENILPCRISHGKHPSFCCIPFRHHTSLKGFNFTYHNVHAINNILVLCPIPLPVFINPKGNGNSARTQRNLVNGKKVTYTTISPTSRQLLVLFHFPSDRQIVQATSYVTNAGHSTLTRYRDTCTATSLSMTPTTSTLQQKQPTQSKIPLRPFESKHPSVFLKGPFPTSTFRTHYIARKCPIASSVLPPSHSNRLAFHLPACVSVSTPTTHEKKNKTAVEPDKQTKGDPCFPHLTRPSLVHVVNFLLSVLCDSQKSRYNPCILPYNHTI